MTNRDTPPINFLLLHKKHEQIQLIRYFVSVNLTGEFPLDLPLDFG